MEQISKRGPNLPDAPSDLTNKCSNHGVLTSIASNKPLIKKKKSSYQNWNL